MTETLRDPGFEWYFRHSDQWFPRLWESRSACRYTVMLQLWPLQAGRAN